MQGATSAYFSNAQVGQIFNKIAGEMKIPPIGLYDTQLQKAFTDQLTNIETKGTSAASAWTRCDQPGQADHRLIDVSACPGPPPSGPGHAPAYPDAHSQPEI